MSLTDLINTAKAGQTMTTREARAAGALLDGMGLSATRTGWGAVWIVEVEGEGELRVCVPCGSCTGVVTWRGDRRVVELESAARPVMPAAPIKNNNRAGALSLVHAAQALAARKGVRI